VVHLILQVPIPIFPSATAVKLPLHHLPIVFLVASLMTAPAATHPVLPGTSIQAKINLAVAGDIVAIFGGTYNEDLTIDKAIRLTEVSGQQVTIAGSISFSGIVDCPPLDGFAVGSSGRGITLTNTTGMVLSNLDMPSGTYVNASASPIRIINCRLHDVTSGGGVDFTMSDAQLSGALSISGAKQEIFNVTIAGGLYQGSGILQISKSTVGGINQQGGTLNTTKVTVGGNFDTQSAALKTVAFRTTVAGDCNWRSKKNWFGYSEARSFNFLDQNDGKVVIVGNKIDRQGGEANGIYCNVSNSSILICNNRVVRVGYGAGWNYWRYYWEGHGDENGIDLRGGSNSALIANHYCQMQHLGGDGAIWGVGIYVRDFAQATVMNNVIVGARFGISAPFGSTAKNNLYWNSPWGSILEANGVVAEGTIYTNPLFVEDETPKLQPTSPCLNAGTPDPRYNNRDGTRNTIGPSGGAWFDPDGWTTLNPVVVSFDVSPDQVLEGVDTEVILSEGLAVSAPP
jgi:hypothetical protein